jgi:hypothetical protein
MPVLMSTGTETLPKATIDVTNACMCTDYNEDTDTETPSEYCFGDCGDFQRDYFVECTREFFGTDMWTKRWEFTNFPTWQGGRNGGLDARNAEEFFDKFFGGMRTDFNATVYVWEDRLTISISHHDGTGIMTVEQGELED